MSRNSVHVKQSFTFNSYEHTGMKITCILYLYIHLCTVFVARICTRQLCTYFLITLQCEPLLYKSVTELNKVGPSVKVE